MLPVAPTALGALLRSSPRGGALVEAALILPFLVLLTVGLFDLGFGLYRYMQVEAAAEAGAQYAARNVWDATAIAGAVTGGTGSSGITASPAPSQMCGCTDSNIFRTAGPPTGGSCASATPACSSGFGIYASVTAQVSYTPLLPYPGLPSTLTLTGQAYRRLN